MTDRFFKGYWMITNKCNLSCSYCILENHPNQLRRELDLSHKKALLSHLYEQMNFRSLTLSGGEVLLIGKKPPSDFIALLEHARQYKSTDPKDNLKIEVYTNATYFNDDVAAAMAGVVDQVAVTVDSISESVLLSIGRRHRGGKKYIDNIVRVINKLTELGISIKLHSVVSTKNIGVLAQEVAEILDVVVAHSGNIDAWKFYQYMSYDAPEVDKVHTISQSKYQAFCKQAKEVLADYPIQLHFKDNQEMNASLFNILSYGNAQYMVDGDSWSSSRRTKDLREYGSMQTLFDETEIDAERFCQFHEMR